MKQTISSFGGITPALGNSTAPGNAVSAIDVDLSSGKLSPAYEDKLYQVVNGSPDSIFSRNGTSWAWGNGKNYLDWKTNGINILFSLDSSGKLKKSIGSFIVDCGQPKPGAATAENATSASQTQRLYLTDETQYIWHKSTSGVNEYYVTKRDGTTTGLAKPGKIRINGKSASEKTPGLLTPYSWGWGDNDSLGFDTVYARTAKDQSGNEVDGYVDLSDQKKYKWTASSTADNYYLTQLDDSAPDFSKPSELMWNPVPAADYNDEIFWDRNSPLVEGTVGSLTGNYSWGWGDDDSLGFDTVYVSVLTDVWGALLVQIGKLPPGAIRARVEADIVTEEPFTSVRYIRNDGNVGNEDGVEVWYVVTFTRSIGGHTDESEPSNPSTSIIAYGDKILVTRPTISDGYVTHWTIYRLSSETGQYLLLAEVDNSLTTYLDDTADADLGIACPTMYTSDQGNEILFHKPEYSFDGLAKDMHAGMIFGWDSNRLIWCEPGYPDAWPSQYYIEFPSTIMDVVPFAGTIAVLTDQGPYRVDGTHPELLVPSKVLGTEPCVAHNAVAIPQGVAYLSDSGVVVFNLTQTQVITNPAFTEAWFTANINPSGVFMAEADGVLYLFHSGGILIGDSRKGTMEWTTSGRVFSAAFKVRGVGDLYACDSQGIKRISKDTTAVKSMIWRSGDFMLNSELDKAFSRVEARGTGQLVCSAFVDGCLTTQKTMHFERMLRDRSMPLPVGTVGRSLQVQFSGTGRLHEFSVQGEIA